MRLIINLINFINPKHPQPLPLMLRHPLLRRAAALFCSLLVLTASVGKVAHVLTEHHNDQPEKHCHAAPGTAHIHSSEYDHPACPLCDFTLPFSVEPSVLEWHLNSQSSDFEASACFYCPPAGIFCPALPAQRGPPAALTTAA